MDLNFFESETIIVFWKMLLAVFLGATIGVEREVAHKFAGMRTHALVALGSVLFTVISQSLSGSTVDPTRIAAQIVTGIGY